ncbi:acetyltransferase [Dolichospermum circinale]|uniref:acetyltransferase n=1 Tax=Dolichospermum circinale TaxID=109265 RepID=UPI0003F890AA|nr:acetyltransferase [Dolichospermum circinale]MDB9476278.1 acetyltransferase [Dolichospermum circinale CS-537/11]MDB9477207.1 acetyltransferase [Dolichospermum circinale CS-537/03]MDB9484090.1 acetyltransferase [Dolichospermum circinale CS-537/05]
MSKIVLLGSSGHALVVIDIVRQQQIYEISGLLDDVNFNLHGTYLHGLRILGGKEQLDTLKTQGIDTAFVAIGDCNARIKLSKWVREKEFKLATIVHSQTVIAPDVFLGYGTLVCAGAVVNSGAKIGNNVIINTSSSVNHECVIEDGVHIGPGVHIGGRTTIKQGAWIGIGATVSDRITIGANSIIGAGAVVVRDIPPGVVAYGVPARVMRGIKEC